MTDREVAGWQFNLKTVPRCQEPARADVWQRWQTNHVKATSAVLDKSRNVFSAGSGKNAVAEKCASFSQLFILIRVCCVFVHCGLMSYISLEISYFYYQLNFPLVLLVFIFEWNKLSVSVRGEKKSLHLASQMRRKEVVKAFWGKRVLELDVLMTERGGKRKLCSTSFRYFDSLVLL